MPDNDRYISEPERKDNRISRRGMVYVTHPDRHGIIMSITKMKGNDDDGCYY